MAACNDAAIGMDFRRAAASTAWIARVGWTIRTTLGCVAPTN